MSAVAKLLLQIIVLAVLMSLGTAQELANSSGETRSIVVNVFDAQGNALTQHNWGVVAPKLWSVAEILLLQHPTRRGNSE